MVAGRNDNNNSNVNWYVGGSNVDNHNGNNYSLISSSWTPSGSYTLTTVGDYNYDGDHTYYWGVQAS